MGNHCRRTMVALLAVFTASLGVAEPGPGAICDTGAFVLRADYAGGRMNDCQVLGVNAVRLSIQPENNGRINPSPWYSFHVRRHAAAGEQELTVRLAYGEHAHRYAPKISSDGWNWQRLGGDAVRETARGAVLRLRPSAEGSYVSAGELLTERFYAAWRERVGVAAGDAEWTVIGESTGAAPIYALVVNPGAANYILLLGRQHPPEVTGALAMTGFVARLLEARAACAGEIADVARPRCRFFETHAFVVVPNLNPDGVQAGHWRHNLAGVDLNRDWGDFSQPETQAVRDLLARLEAARKRPRAMLDFHSTRRNVFFTQDAAAPTRPARFAKRWLDAAKRARGELYEFENDPRRLSEAGTTKNYFYRRFGVPSITFEVADEEDRALIASSAAAFADALVDVFAAVDAAPSPPCEDFFCHMAEANAASLIMLAETGLLDAERASRIASAAVWVVEEQSRPGAVRAANYLPFEKRLIELAGVDAANVHLGRSRQDLHGTARRMMARQEWLALISAVLRSRTALLALARREANTPIPAYTHGVQAQPTTFGHYLLAFSAALRRDAERLMDGFSRLNRSPLGAAALGTSGFPLDRHRLAALLGFAAPVENSYDANLVASADFKLELAGTLTTSAVTVGQLAQNIHTQYHNPRPWILLDAQTTSRSTIMPQKRNPRPLDRLRSAASGVVAKAQAVVLQAHNTNTGMHDYRQNAPLLELTSQARDMYQRKMALVRSLSVDDERAAEELARGYSTMTEVADTLLREAGVPFRTAHAYASALTDHCRSQGVAATRLSDRELRSIYHAVTGQRLPLAPDIVRAAFAPAKLIANRRGFGGPQPAEMRRSLAAHDASLATQRRWLMDAQGALTAARTALQAALDRLHMDSDRDSP